MDHPYVGERLWRREDEIHPGSFYKERATTIRINGNATTKEELIRELTGEGIQVKEHPLLASALLISGYDYLAAIPAFREGKFQVQDAARSW